ASEPRLQPGEPGQHGRSWAALLLRSHSLSTVEETLRRLEESLLQPDVRRDAAAVESLLADEFREFGSSGRVYNREQAIAALQTEGRCECSLTDFQATLIANSLALVTYKAAQRGQGGKAVSFSLRSSLWIHRDGRWQALFHQGTAAQS